MLENEITGHPEIDKQHELLNNLVKKLDGFCHNKNTSNISCLNCPNPNSHICINNLSELISELIGFMIDHFSYEEKLMRLLPNNQECRDHINSHTKAHADISAMLCQLASSIENEDPAFLARKLRNILNSWIGNHSKGHDNVLALSLEGAYKAEVELDVALTRLLGK